ncbi:dicarboxylate--CoA ligase PimA [Enterovirga rhinocerotis]|uniref:Long-chain-fatty-acid--CoA ligase n=1 Tax=Enterovirga rhinocerotis TaxID=1339210 RepID=A0A4R7C5I7_9HYPH|nr:dicarboxylate--CoA ligase PimA [Enterovirga rhinocerotis]TDR93162.1 long-chain acyl-CoA synthetase [Enterovirga rhinocerotis]
MGRPFAWETSYPPGLAWDAPIVRSTVPDLLAKAARRFGPRPALDFRGRKITYAELEHAAERVAAALIAQGLRPGEPLALYLPNTPYHPFAFLGGAKAGLRMVHLSPLDAEQELVHKLADSGARTLVTTNVGGMADRARALLDAGHLDLVIVGEDAAFGPAPQPAAAIEEGPGFVRLSTLTDEASAPPEWPRIGPDDIALLQYTGGTTGKPKGAILTHGNLTAAISMYETWFRGMGGDAADECRMICVLPLFHIYALTTILLRGLDRGAEILLRQRFDVETTLHDIEIGRATHFAGVPTMWIALASAPGIETRDFSSLVYTGSGGAPLPVEVETRFERLTGHRLIGGWGMTETSPAGTNRMGMGARKPGTIGVPLPGIEIDICALDDPRRVLGIGETGELRIRGLNVTQGYWKRPEETAAAFVDGWFLAGDIGHMDEDGFFFITDRKKDMIISGGFNVYPQVIEQAIYQHPAVEECLVVGIPDGYRGEAAKAFVKLREGAPPLTLEALQAFLGDKIGRHEMPAALETRPALPRTPVGKLSKLELRAEEREKAARDAARRGAA